MYYETVRSQRFNVAFITVLYTSVYVLRYSEVGRGVQLQCIVRGELCMVRGIN